MTRLLNVCLCCTLLMLHFFHIALVLYFTLFRQLSFHVALFSCCFFWVALPSCSSVKFFRTSFLQKTFEQLPLFHLLCKIDATMLLESRPVMKILRQDLVLSKFTTCSSYIYMYILNLACSWNTQIIYCTFSEEVRISLIKSRAYLI